jgi:tRNA dimethylallyltransferase
MTIHPDIILFVICGATATGKSGLGLELAERLGSIILSADSRQVYRDFDIGTAKPSPAQQQQIPHYLINICAPTETLTLADYQGQAQALITSSPSSNREVGEWGVGSGEWGVGEEKSKIKTQNSKLKTQNSPLLLVGGTGLYIKSIVRGLKIPRVAPNPELRSQLSALGQIQLYNFLQQVDPIATQKIHANDEVRTLRALEVFYVTGKPISQQQGENPPNYPIFQIGLDCQSDALTRRIAQRTEEMLEMGLVKEVETLCNKYGWDLPLLDTLGYREIKQYLAGEVSLNEAKDLTILHTRQFAKRQRTWFRAIPEIEWFDVDSYDLLDLVWQFIGERLSSFEE